MSADAGPVRVGDRLPELRRRVTGVGLFLFGVAHWTPHRIHWDAEYARESGFRGPLVTANLLSAFHAQLVTAWAGSDSRLLRLEERNVGAVVAGDEIVATGEVTDVSRAGADVVATCSLLMTVRDGAPAVTGTARVVLGRRRAAVPA